MPTQPTLDHRYIKDTALPYRTYGSPTSTDPDYSAGSNVLTSANEYAERRPGFSAFESSATTFTGDIKRQLVWRRWGSTFYAMVNEVTATQSKVYKLAIGVDSSYSLIFTSSSTEPFDFVVSNNYLFFGNGTDMKKWDGTTVTNWGITGPASAPTITVTAKAPSTASGTNWTSASSVTAQDGVYATYSGTTQDDLKVTGFSITLPTNSTVVGVIVNVVGHASDATAANRQIRVGLTKDGTALVGARKTAQTLNLTADTIITMGTATDLWSATFTQAEVEASTFGVLIGDNDVTAAGTLSIDYVTVQVFYNNTVSITASAGGYQYLYSYGSSASGHVSSPSPLSTSTGNFTTSSVGVSVTASADTQVNRIHVFRTTDGGGGIYFEITGSPFTNTTQMITDTTADTSLSSTTAPTGGVNDPPPVSKGFVWYANRIWMFVNNLVWMTGWEEINNGVAEECVPSGGAGNFWAFSSEVTGLSVLEDGVLVYSAGAIYKISGDSLDTFWRSTYAYNLGVRERATIARLGKVTAWLDSSNSVWITNGQQLEEVGLDIRPDLKTITHTSASMTFYTNKTFRWLCLLDGGAGKLRIFDLDKSQWMPPWSIGGSSITTGETSSGVWDLLVGHSSKKALKLDTTVYSDDGTAYSCFADVNLQDIVPDQKPGMVGLLEYVSIEHNGYGPSDVRVAIDEDITQVSNPRSIFQNREDAAKRTQGISIVNDWYYDREQQGRRAAIRFDWGANTNPWRLYTIDLGIQTRP